MTDGQRAAGLPVGLRERKKRRTRDALLRAALDLFTTQGYEETTVDEIADAVEVSQRTFFRYFAGKESVAFAVQDMVESRFILELRQRPAAETPFEAMRRAVLCAWNSIGEAIEALIPVELHMRTYRMIESTPPCSPPTCGAASPWRSRSPGSSPSARAWTWHGTRGRAWPSPRSAR